MSKKRAGPGVELRQLKGFIGEIEDQFIAAHLASASLGAPTRKEVLDVAAYVVLAHGALESFVEGLSLWLITRLESRWIQHQRANGATAVLLLHEKPPAAKQGKNKQAGNQQPQALFDRLRKAIQEARKTVSARIEDNNGVSTRHLTKLLQPLGVDVPTDPVLTASLDLLVAMRHQWAHQNQFGAKVYKSASDAQKVVSDCVQVAERLADSARRAVK